MKINKMKGAIGVLAVTAVVSLVGSISGTMAWLQYNTRARVEMYGTTAKCTENLQIRTVSNWGVSGIAAVAKANNKASIPAGSYSDGNKAITDDGKVYTYSGSDWGDGVAPSAGDKYDVSGTIWNWSGSAWAEVATTYGDWKSTLLPADINAAADRKLTDDVFLPVTNPGLDKDDALGTFYNHPVAGHEYYNTGTYKWKAADSGYLQFTVQFRVLDIDGKTDVIDLAQALYMTDFQVVDVASPKTVKEALRFHISNKTAPSNKLYGLQETPDATASFKTVTHGHLDLDGDGDYDTKADVPQKYSWDDDSTVLLDYGGASSEQTYYNMSRTGTGAATFFAVPDDYGGLTKSDGTNIDGTPIGTTTAGTEGSGVGQIGDKAHLTFTFTMWLEGWHAMERPAADVSKGAVTTVTDHNAAGTYTKGALYSDAAGLATSKLWLYMGKNALNADVWNEIALQAGDVYELDSEYKVVNDNANGFGAVVTEAKSAMWDDNATVGAQFNIGMSFGIDALDPIKS